MKIKFTNTNTLYNAKTIKAIANKWNELFGENMTEKEVATCFASDGWITTPNWIKLEDSRYQEVKEEHQLDFEKVFIDRIELNGSYIAIDFIGKGWDRYCEFSQVYGYEVYGDGDVDVTFDGYAVWREYSRKRD